MHKRSCFWKIFGSERVNKLNSGIKKDTEVTLKLASNIFGDSNDENNFPYKFLFTNS